MITEERLELLATFALATFLLVAFISIVIWDRLDSK